jgi:cellulose synthase (UDP-forming)
MHSGRGRSAPNVLKPNMTEKPQDTQHLNPPDTTVERGANLEALNTWNPKRGRRGERVFQHGAPGHPAGVFSVNIFGTPTNFWIRLLRLVVLSILLFFAYQCITIKLQWPEQAVIGCVIILLAVIANRVFPTTSYSLTLIFMLVSMIATGRYAYWRISMVVQAFIDHDPSTHWDNVFFLLLLLSAELYAFAALYLGYVQNVRPLHRPPVALPNNVEEWPHVDLMIPTFNEDLSVVRTTIFAALNIEYPQDKLHIYVLDDGNRDEFKQFCAVMGCGYIARQEHSHAKAGNLNNALRETTSPYVAIFDCDHIPCSSFLHVTLGWFLRDPRLAMLQTPHYFYSPDPFERNLDQFQKVPNEGWLFYGFVQDGNDLWNATFFCGSCAVLRREALAEIGGIATDTVTEDAHTALRMQILGWNTAYINIPQSAGLATETLARHIGQRIRWARGMTQVLRMDNPLFANTLTLPQRICYFNATLHYLNAAPRLIFLTAPLVYLLLGRINIPGDWIAIVAFAAPHLVLALMTNHRAQGSYRHTLFWNEIYEFVLAPYILLPTTLALINPKLGKFNVTSKGGVIEESYFDLHIAWPYILLIYLNLAALLAAPIRFLLQNPDHRGAVVMNAVWICLDLIILGAANAVAFERQQRRKTVRINLSLNVELKSQDGLALSAETINASLSGAMLRLSKPITLEPGVLIEVLYPRKSHFFSIPAHVVECREGILRLQHDELTLEQEEQLTVALYSAPDTWVKQIMMVEPDRPLRNSLRIVGISIRGIGLALTALLPGRKVRTVAATAMFALLLATTPTLRAAAAQPKPPTATTPAPQSNATQTNTTQSNTIHSSFQLYDLGVPDAIIFRGVAASRDVAFALPQTEVPQHATLALNYAFSPGLIPQVSQINVKLNGVLVTSLPMPDKKNLQLDAMHTTIDLPTDLLVRKNVLGFEFVGHYALQCEDSNNTALWARIEDSSRIDISGAPFSLGDDLKILPLPFYDGAVSSAVATIPVVFASRPSNHALEAAGAVVSWFGVLARSRPLNFPVTIGTPIPRGNAILFVERYNDMPPGLDLNRGGPTVAIRTNPSDPYGKLLIIAGSDGDQLLAAARGLALGNSLLQGRTVSVTDMQLPAPREADDAPLWLSPDRISPFWNYTGEVELQTDGSGPVAVYLRVPPDLYYSSRQNLPLHVDYRYNSISLAKDSTMRLSANGSLVNEIGLPRDPDPKQTLEHNFAVPLASMRPFSNTLLFNFYFQAPKSGGTCTDSPPIDFKGVVLRSSYFDLRGLYHWAPMPNLELFANAGFPFTRFADLSQTRIIMPPQSSPAEMSLYLALMAYFGEETGYPTLRVQVGNPSALGSDADYLILGNPTDQPAFQQLSPNLHVAVQNDGFTVQGTSGFFALIEQAWWHVSEVRPDWWWRLGRVKERSGLMASLSEFPDTLLQGIQSPWGIKRSIVTITLRNDDSVKPFLDAFWKHSMAGDISQSVSVLHGNEFSSYRLGNSYYYVGHLPWWLLVRFWIRTYPGLIVAISIVIALLLLPILLLRLRNRVRLRLGIPPRQHANQ